jgi:hypothetical protein
LSFRPRKLGMLRRKCPVCGRGLSSYGSQMRGICALCEQKVKVLTK